MKQPNSGNEMFPARFLAATEQLMRTIVRVRAELFRENDCGQEARCEHFTTRVWLFHVLLFESDLDSHSESGLLTQKLFGVRKFSESGSLQNPGSVCVGVR